MYLSYLLINVGENPDRPRPGRLWLRNLYRVHQRLCMGFPSAERKKQDEDFLKPFVPGDFGDGQVHVARATEAGFLFRIDPQPGGGVVILVQSATEPDWDYAFHNAIHFLAAPPEVKPFNPSFGEHQRLRFRLVANPTRKIDTKTAPDGTRRNGRRVPVSYDGLSDWLARKAKTGGFSVADDLLTLQTGYVYVADNKRTDAKRLWSVRYDGILNVMDPTRFQVMLASGIGPGKAFGFGLLSIAPVAWRPGGGSLASE